MNPENQPHREQRLPFPRPASRRRVRPGRAPDPKREKCDFFLSTCVTEAEIEAFESLRLREPFPPSKSTFTRFLIKAALRLYEDGFPEGFVAAWLTAGLPQWWGPEASSDAPAPPQGGPRAAPPGAKRPAAAPQAR
jgi:hypothetical protein